MLASLIASAWPCTLFAQTKVVDFNSSWAGPMNQCVTGLGDGRALAAEIGPEDYARIAPIVSAVGRVDFAQAGAIAVVHPLVQLIRTWGYDHRKFGALDAVEQRNLFVKAALALEKQSDEELAAGIQAAEKETDVKRLSSIAESLEKSRMAYGIFVSPENRVKVTTAVAAAHRRTVQLLKVSTDRAVQALASGAGLLPGAEIAPTVANSGVRSRANNLLNFPKKHGSIGIGMGNSDEPTTADGFVAQGNLLEENVYSVPESQRPGLAFTNNIEQALWAYDRALELDPSHAAAHVDRGLINHYRGRHDLARYDFVEAIRSDPKFAFAYLALARDLHNANELRLAAAIYEKGLALDPKVADAHYNLALVYNALHEARNALVHWKEYLKLDPEGEVGALGRDAIEKLLQQNELQVIAVNKTKESSGLNAEISSGKPKLELVHKRDPKKAG